MNASLKDRIFNVSDNNDFRGLAMEVFNYQYHNCSLYKYFVNSLGKNHSEVHLPEQIPFMPVEFFRDHKIISGNLPVKIVFESSGTTGVSTSKHFVTDLQLYERSFLKAFSQFYANPEDYLICALLPSYTERKGSSLVYMANKLIQKSKHTLSGFYKGDFDSLLKVILQSKEENRKIILLGVSFALLDLAEEFAPDLSGVIVMETGGMKGRRKELTRTELHLILKEKFNVSSIHSEYGMTELLSQAYSKGEGIYYSPPWMKIIIRDLHDPFSVSYDIGKTGGINIIDLANINSCSFLATNDLGKLHKDGGFEVLGRFDNSDIRGCNLLVD